MINCIYWRFICKNTPLSLSAQRVALNHQVKDAFYSNLKYIDKRIMWRLILPLPTWTVEPSPPASFPFPISAERKYLKGHSKVHQETHINHCLTRTRLFLASWTASSVDPSTCVAGSANKKMRSRWTTTGSWPSLLQGTLVFKISQKPF